jgi:hypothetical protein
MKLLMTAVWVSFFGGLSYGNIEEKLRIDSVSLSGEFLHGSTSPRIQCFASVSRGMLDSVSVLFEGDWISVPDQELGQWSLPDLSGIEVSVLDFWGTDRLRVTVPAKIEILDEEGQLAELRSAEIRYCFLRGKYSYKEVIVEGRPRYYSIPQNSVYYEDINDLLEAINIRNPFEDWD